jgi:hypothetical protein
MATEIPIILVRSADYSQNWQTITADDLDAIRHIDTMFNGFFSEHHDFFCLDTYAEFCEWIFGYGYERDTIEEFYQFTQDEIDFLHSPEVNNQMISQLNNWFAKYKRAGYTGSEQPNEEIITLNGKRYKLID